MITEERIEEMKEYFWAETNDPETEEWREDLTKEEAALVESWDDDYSDAFYGILKKIAETAKKKNSTSE